jgi:hypothetical protein
VHGNNIYLYIGRVRRSKRKQEGGKKGGIMAMVLCGQVWEAGSGSPCNRSNPEMGVYNSQLSTVRVSNANLLCTFPWARPVEYLGFFSNFMKRVVS